MKLTFSINDQSVGKTLTMATVDFSDPWNPGPPVTILTVTGQPGVTSQDCVVDVAEVAGSLNGTLDTGGDPIVWVYYKFLYGPEPIDAPHWTIAHGLFPPGEVDGSSGGGEI